MVKKVGDHFSNVIYGTPNNDVYSGKNGDDAIYGGDGSDTIHGGNGSDYIEDDVVYLDNGDVILPTIGGNDLLYGDGGNDFISIFTGNDTADGGLGNDTIVNDSPGVSLLIGGAGDDSIWSGYGSAVINPGSGNDTVEVDYYKNGSDTFVFEKTQGGFGTDTVTGFNQNFPTVVGDRVEFKGYRQSDLTSPPTDVGGGTLFSFKDGSSLLLNGVVNPVLNSDYFFV